MKLILAKHVLVKLVLVKTGNGERGMMKRSFSKVYLSFGR